MRKYGDFGNKRVDENGFLQNLEENIKATENTFPPWFSDLFHLSNQTTENGENHFPQNKLSHT